MARWSVVAAVVGVTIVLGGSLARADAVADASKAFSAGEAADRRRDYTAAITFYQRAYELKPHPNAAYNIAFDYERLGKYRDAYEWYETYRDTTTDPDEKATTVAKLDQLLHREATIAVLSHPIGAELQIDGALVGKTPYQGTIGSGRHFILIGREPREVEVLYGEPVEIEVELSPEQFGTPTVEAPLNPPSLVDPKTLAPRPGEPGGGIRILNGPKGAYVYIDTQPVGVIGVWAGELEVGVGAHDVEIRAQGFAPFKQNVYVTAHEESNVTVPDTLKTTEELADESSLKVRRLFGAAAGVGFGKDATGEMAFAEFGTRIRKADFVGRIGESNGKLAIDVAFRYSIGGARIKPVIGIGYSYIGGVGYELIAGLRYDLKRTGDTRFAVIAESGVRVAYVKAEGSTSMGDPHGLVPVLVFVEVAR